MKLSAIIFVSGAGEQPRRVEVDESSWIAHIRKSRYNFENVTMDHFCPRTGKFRSCDVAARRVNVDQIRRCGSELFVEDGCPTRKSFDVNFVPRHFRDNSLNEAWPCFRRGIALCGRGGTHELS